MKSGYWGIDCINDARACDSSPCHHGGTCDHIDKEHFFYKSVLRTIYLYSTIYL